MISIFFTLNQYETVEGGLRHSLKISNVIRSYYDKPDTNLKMKIQRSTNLTNDHATQLQYSHVYLFRLSSLLLVDLKICLFDTVVLSEDLLHRCDDGGGADARHDIRPRDQPSSADVRPQGSQHNYPYQVILITYSM